MKYLVLKTVGNGYGCHCCREEHQTHDIEEFATDSEAVQYAIRINDDFCRGFKERDIHIDKILRLAEDPEVF